MGILDSTVDLNYGMEKKVTTGKVHPLGTRGVTPDGRVFWYSRAGATALANGVSVCQKGGEANNTHNVNLTIATSIGDYNATAGAPGIQVGSATIGVVWTSAHSSAEYIDGYMTVETSPGMGTYRVVADGAVTVTGGASVIRLHPDDTIVQEVLTTVTKLAFQHNPFSSVIVTPVTVGAAALTGIVLGVTQVEVPIDNYFWLQSSGMAHVRYDAIIAALIGHSVISGPGATAGDAIGGPRTTVVTTAALTTLSQLAYGSFPVLGYAMGGIPGDGDFLQVMLTLRS
jgi:hypothetical protein